MFRHVFWFLGWAAVAVALALLVGQNQSSITVFWPPYRIDLSFNLVLFALVALFLLLHFSLRGAASLLAMPERARRWRALQLERAAVAGVMDALSNQIAGRFVRAQTAATEALGHLHQIQEQQLPRHAQITALAHLLLAESAQWEIVAENTFTGAALIFLVARAFSSGTTALTGIEAVANGVPAFFVVTNPSSSAAAAFTARYRPASHAMSSADTCPPMRSTRPRTITNPRPLPSARVRSAPRRLKGSNR